MPDKFDPYREALVVEQNTVWAEAYDDWETSEKQRGEADPRETDERTVKPGRSRNPRRSWITFVCTLDSVVKSP